MTNALDYAMQLVAQGKVQETHGKNRSPLIDIINTAVGIPLGSPYCAAGISYCFRQTRSKILLATPKALGEVFPYSGGSQFLKQWFNERGWLSYDPTEMIGWSGALGGWTNKDKAHGHVFMVRQRLTIGLPENRKVVRIGTTEFNTSPDTKGRDGQGAYNLTRDVPVDGGHKLWFADVSQIMGGIFWTR